MTYLVGQLGNLDHFYIILENSNSSDYIDEYDDEEEVEEDYTDENTADKYFACEKKFNLFVLQQLLFIKDNFPGELSTSER